MVRQIFWTCKYAPWVGTQQIVGLFSPESLDPEPNELFDKEINNNIKDVIYE